jgi:hypothetical protein
VLQAVSAVWSSQFRWRWSAAEADLGNDGSSKTTKATIATQVTNHVAHARCLNLVFQKEKVSTKGAADKFNPFSVTSTRIDKMQFLLTTTTQTSCSLEFICQNQSAIQQYFSLITNQHQHQHQPFSSAFIASQTG